MAPSSYSSEDLHKQRRIREVELRQQIKDLEAKLAAVSSVYPDHEKLLASEAFYQEYQKYMNDKACSNANAVVDALFKRRMLDGPEVSYGG